MAVGLGDMTCTVRPLRARHPDHTPVIRPLPQSHSEQVVSAALRAGYDNGERVGYVEGWRYGFLCGFIPGTLIGAAGLWAAIQIGRIVGAT